MMTAARSEPAITLFGTAGEIHSADVLRVFDQAVSAGWAGGQTVVLDVAGVTSWSPMAQAMLIGIAVELARQRSSLSLVGASLSLRMQSQRLDVFTRVRELSQHGSPWR